MLATSHPLRSWKTVAAIIVVAGAHFALALGAFAQAYALGDAAMPVPRWLVAANAVLGFPAFVVVPTSAMIGLRPWLGDDANGLLLLFVLNGLFWATVVVLAVQTLRRRHARGPQPLG